MATPSTFLSKFLAKEAITLARSGFRSIVKQQAKGAIDSFKAKSPTDIANQIKRELGYSTSHYKLNKDQTITYKPSSLFFLEWLNNSPTVKGKILQDEENGQLYYQDRLLTTADKIQLLEIFVQQTKSQSTVLIGYLNAALKNLDPSDFTAAQFKTLFAGWDPNSPSVIDSWLSNVFGPNFTENPAYANFLFKKWIVGAAKRITQPGVSHDGCLTLRGLGGKGKTLFFRNLMPVPFEKRTGEIYAAIKSPQKLVESMLGKSIATFDELSVLEYPQTEEIFKQLLSSQFVDVRLAWRRDPRRFNLRCAWAATTNKEQFIRDPFLSRRLWTIELSKESQFNLEFLRENRNQLWKEALYLANQGVPNFLTPEEQVQVEAHNKKFQVSEEKIETTENSHA